MVYIEAKIHERIIEKKRRLDQHRPLSPSLLGRLRREFIVEYTFDSNAIEGSTLTLHETRMVIEEGLTVNGRPLRDVIAARNHPEAIEYVEGLAEASSSLTEEHVLTLHRLIMVDVDEDAGHYRESGVRIAGALFTPPKSVEVPAMMRGLLEWLDRNLEELTPVELAAIFHQRFVTIHPFAEGNGRTARLLMNLILMKSSYPFIVSVPRQDRDKYIRSLREADQGDMGAFVNFVARCAERALDLYLNVLEERDVMSLAEASRLTTYSQEYLSLLARNGRLGAFKEGRNWRVSRSELERYLEEVGKKRRG